MVRFCGAKINLGLHITEKRTDGFHNLETIFLPVDVADILEVLRLPASNVDSLTAFGILLEGPPENNLVIRAIKALRHRFPNLPPVQCLLQKNIPIGAGLGGGSSNAAGLLVSLNKLFELKLSEFELMEIGLELGSDVPFFVKNQPCFASGRGELLEPIDITPLDGYSIVLVNPHIHVNTGWAFAQIKPTPVNYSLKASAQLPIEEWRNRFSNDFEGPICAFYPVIGQLIAQLYNQGAIYAAMSGSGSTCFGIFKTNTSLSLSNFKNYWVREIRC